MPTPSFPSFPGGFGTIVTGGSSGNSAYGSGGRGSGGGYSPQYGGKPVVPDPAASASAAIAANLANWPSLASLIGKANTQSALDAANALRLNLPNYDALTRARSTVLGTMLGGQLPTDVISQILQAAAERGIATGSPSGPGANASYLKALGLNSLGMMTKGMEGLSGAIRDTPTGTQVRPESMFLTPDAIQAARMAQALYDAAPDPRFAYGGGGGRTPSIGGLAGAAPVRLGGGGPTTGPYRNPEPQYGTYVGGALGPFNDTPGVDPYSLIPRGGIYQGGGDFNAGDYWAQEPNYGTGGSWGGMGQPDDFWAGPSTDWYDWMMGGGDPYQAMGWQGGGSNPYQPMGYEPIMDVSQGGPNWWDIVNEGSDYYDFSSADFGFEG